MEHRVTLLIYVYECPAGHRPGYHGSYRDENTGAMIAFLEVKCNTPLDDGTLCELIATHVGTR